MNPAVTRLRGHQLKNCSYDAFDIRINFNKAAELAVSSEVFRFTLTTRLPCCLLTNMSLPFSTFQEYLRDTSEIPEF